MRIALQERFAACFGVAQTGVCPVLFVADACRDTARFVGSRLVQSLSGQSSRVMVWRRAVRHGLLRWSIPRPVAPLLRKADC